MVPVFDIVDFHFEKRLKNLLYLVFSRREIDRNMTQNVTLLRESDFIDKNQAFYRPHTSQMTFNIDSCELKVLCPY